MILCSDRGLLQNNPVQTWGRVCRWYVVGPGSVIVEVGRYAHGASLYFIIKIKRKQEWRRRGWGGKKKGESTNYHLGGRMRGRCIWLSDTMKSPLEIRELESEVRTESTEVCVFSAMFMTHVQAQSRWRAGFNQSCRFSQLCTGTQNIIHPSCWWSLGRPRKSWSCFHDLTANLTSWFPSPPIGLDYI